MSLTSESSQAPAPPSLVRSPVCEPRSFWKASIPRTGSSCPSRSPRAIAAKTDCTHLNAQGAVQSHRVCQVLGPGGPLSLLLHFIGGKTEAEKGVIEQVGLWNGPSVQLLWAKTGQSQWASLIWLVRRPLRLSNEASLMGVSGWAGGLVQVCSSPLGPPRDRGCASIGAALVIAYQPQHAAPPARQPVGTDIWRQ